MVACMKEEGGGDEVRPSLCPSMGNPDLVFQETGDCSPTHSRRLNDIAHKLSSLTQLDRADRMVPPVRVFSSNMLLVALGLIGLFFATWLNNKLSQLASLETDPPIWTMIQSVCHGRIWTHMPSHWWPSWASGGEVAALPMQGNHSDCSKWPNMPGSGISWSCEVRFLGTCPTCSLNHLVRLLTGICQD